MSPGYQAAKEAISALKKADVDEVRSYREPPEPVKYVVNALCLLFEKPENWEEGKKLLIREDFLQDLIFFDKSHLPQEKFDALQVYVTDPCFQESVIVSVSKAAAAFCVWVHAINNYTVIYRSSQTLIESLGAAEERYSKVHHLSHSNNNSNDDDDSNNNNIIIINIVIKVIVLHKLHLLHFCCLVLRST